MRARTCNAFIVAASIGQLLTACTSDTSKPPTLEEYVEARCRFATPCCARAGLPDGSADCRKALLDHASRTTFMVSAADACLRWLRATEGRPSHCQNLAGPHECLMVFGPQGPRGNKQPGEACESPSDCAAPATSAEVVECRQPPGATPWCQVQLRGNAGDGPCVATISPGRISEWPEDSQKAAKGYLCHETDDVYCDWDSRRCTRKAAIGESCPHPAACRHPAFCSVHTRVCEARRPIGAACRAPDLCVEGGFCQRSTQTCVATVAEGMPCTTAEECLSSRCVDDKCGPNLDPDIEFNCGRR